MTARIGFDNEKYLRLQSQHIRERIDRFGGKLYLEFGGKLYDDNHASRVLPGFQPDSKMKMLLELKDEAEIVIVINAGDIEKNKKGDMSKPHLQYINGELTNQWKREGFKYNFTDSKSSDSTIKIAS